MLKHLSFVAVYGFEMLKQIANDNYLTHYNFAKKMNSVDILLFLAFHEKVKK